MPGVVLSALRLLDTDMPKYTLLLYTLHALLSVDLLHFQLTYKHPEEDSINCLGLISCRGFDQLCLFSNAIVLGL